MPPDLLDGDFLAPEESDAELDAKATSIAIVDISDQARTHKHIALTSGSSWDVPKGASWNGAATVRKEGRRSRQRGEIVSEISGRNLKARKKHACRYIQQESTDLRDVKRLSSGTFKRGATEMGVFAFAC